MKKGGMKLMAAALASVMALSLAGCGRAATKETTKAAETKTAETKAEGETSVKEEAAGGKIGLMVGTVAISEEEYRTAESWQKKLGADEVVIQTYPDNFMSEEETTISNMLSLVSDPEIKVVIFVQGVPGASAAIAKAKETRPDILYINGGPNEDPDVACAAADICIDYDNYSAGNQMAERAKEMGAETIVYYSFPRHQGYEKVAYQGNQCEAKAKELGMEFVRVTIPDPQSDAGTAGTQQFIVEDVPKELETYGEKTAFFDTNTMSTPAVIQALYKAGKGIYMNPSQSSPFCGYPEALGLSVPEDKTSDYEWMIGALQDKLKETGDNGRFSTREIPTVVMEMNTAVEYAKLYLSGETDGKVDMAALEEAFKTATGGSEGTSFTTYDVNGKKYDNFALVLGPWAML